MMTPRTRSRSLRAWLAPLVSVAPLVLAACGGALESAGEVPAVEPEAIVTARARLDSAFARAAARSDVPEALLKAVSYAQTRWYMVPGAEPEYGAPEPAYGLLALRGEALARGARLAGLSEQAVREDAEANLRAGAALLRAEADALGLSQSDRRGLSAWGEAVARLSGIPNEDARAHFVHEEVYRALRDGVPLEEQATRAVTLTPTPGVRPALDPPSAAWRADFLGATTRYSGALWRPAPASNFTAGRRSAVSLLVVHTCAGGYSGCVGWLTTPYPQNPYKTSAHYVVNESGGEISQLVDEDNTAHHVGASWQGQPTNPRSVGIEHGGFSYAGTNRWTEGQLAASARLACDIVKRHNIVRDRQHIIGHYQPDPQNRANDPGTAFPWADYMSRIDSCLGGGGGGATTITIDSNQANNGANASVEVGGASSSWVSSTNVAGFYGSGYYAAPTASVSDAMVFRFYLATAQRRSVHAWWTAAGDRSTTTPFVIFAAGGARLDTVQKNQQVDGGKWNLLGTYDFPVGWSQVAVSRWTTAGKYVIADAIQVR